MIVGVWCWSSMWRWLWCSAQCGPILNSCHFSSHNSTHHTYTQCHTHNQKVNHTCYARCIFIMSILYIHLTIIITIRVVWDYSWSYTSIKIIQLILYLFFIKDCYNMFSTLYSKIIMLSVSLSVPPHPAGYWICWTIRDIYLFF